MKLNNDVELRGKYADTQRRLDELKKKRNECLAAGSMIEARNIQKEIVQLTKDITEIDQAIFS